MKKALSVIFFITGALILISVGCKTRQIPGAPYDCTPTATGEPTNRVSITIIDYDTTSNTSAAHDVNVMLHYPGGNPRTVSASVVSGTAEMYVYSNGQYMVEILPNTINGYSNSVFDTINVSGPFSQKTINRYEPTGFTVSTPVVQSFNKTGGLFTYTLTYHTNTPRRITFTVQTNATEGAQYWFEPVTETVNNGDTVRFKVFIPAYYQLPYSDFISSGGLLQFRFIGTDSKLNTYLGNAYNITQAWHFYVVIPAYRGIAGGGGMGVLPYRGFLFNSITFDTANITEYGDRVVDYEDIEIFDGTAWRDNTYWGGQKDHQIGGQWYGSPIEIPFIMPAWTTLNWLRIVYNNCYTIPSVSIKITLKITWGNLIYRNTFTTSNWYY
jgi:hypothetical protein